MMKKSIPFHGTMLSTRQLQVVELIAKGFTVPYIAQTLLDEYPEINQRKVRRDLESIYINLGLVESEAEVKLYNQNILLSNLYYEWAYGARQVQQKLQSHETHARINADGSLPWEDYYVWRGSGFIKSLSMELQLPPSEQHFFNDQPLLEIQEFDAEDKIAEPRIDYEYLQPHLARWRYVFQPSPPEPVTCQMCVRTTTPQRKSLTQTENYRFWSDLQRRRRVQGYLANFTGKEYCFTEFEAMSKNSFHISFPLKFPVRDLQLMIFDEDWCPITGLNDHLKDNHRLRINNDTSNNYSGDPIFHASVDFEEGQNTIAAFHWTPLVQ